MAEVKPFRKKPNQVEEKTVDNIISDILNTSKEKDKKEEKKVDLVVTPGDLLSISPLLGPIAKNPLVKEKLNIINAESLNEGQKSLSQEIDDIIVGGAKDLAYSFADLIAIGILYAIKAPINPPIKRNIKTITNPIEKLPMDKKVTVIAIIIPKIPKKFPCRDVSGEESPLKAKINNTPEIK